MARGKAINAASASFQSLLITTVASTITIRLSLSSVATESAAVFCSMPTSFVTLDISAPVEFLVK